ncbi:c-type cytochrome [Arenibacter latericius]|uniref:c-type cytochrome n=1 Tax=Arenibacter latericius TaxID=86104 RepID=UPI00040C0EDD|nr:cytochrome c [Arenibacter latericius]MDX1364104.1 cytochrome c [Arenibacter latericius]
MNNFSKIGIVLGLVLLVASCANNRNRNFEFMPDMYKSVGYETYQQVDFLPDGSSAGLPADNTIARGWIPYGIENTIEGKEQSRVNPSPLDSLNREENLQKGKELYAIYCSLCHGDKGDGQGNLVKREKILGVPSYADVARNVTVGSTYHVIYYGLNSMGSYAGQLDIKERWQVAEYVMTLKEDLTK